MLRTLHNKIERVSDLITEYDKDEDRCRNPNPALHDFVQKLKVILNFKVEIARKDGANCSKSGSNRNDVASRSSSSSSSQINGCDSNTNSKVAEALRNHVVLTEIFKCGNFRDLKNFRLINKQWKGIANSAIIRRRLWKLSFINKFSASDSDRNGALSELNNCIEASEGSFPLTTIDFSYMNDYNNLSGPVLLRFYTLVGQSIKHVIFEDFGPLTMREFQDLLHDKMPNVNDVNAGHIFFTDQEEFCVPIVLPYLKTIRFLEHYDDETDEVLVLPYYKDLLLAATNLKEIHDFQLHLTDIIIETEKVDCIQSFTFDLQLETDMSAQFSHTEPKLVSLHITRLDFDNENLEIVLPQEVSQSLTRILMSSKDTLKHLRCLPRVFSVDFEPPKFPNLEFLTVYDDTFSMDGSDQVPPPRVFSAGCDISQIFPNLHNVSFDMLLRGGETLCKYFPDQAFPSVKTVAFKRTFQLGRSLTTIFPNVSHIKIIDFERIMSQTEEFPSFLGGIYSELDSQIESLEINQCILAHLGRKFQLDSLFTGVPTDLCARLLEIHENCGASDEDEDSWFVKRVLQVVQTQNYMFRNSEGLRRLKIIFNDSNNASFRITRARNSDSDVDSAHGSGNKNVQPLTPVISPISCIYGFSLMPNLEEVIIGYDHDLPNASDIAQVFKPFARFPYVKIVHEPTFKGQWWTENLDPFN